MHAYMHTCIHKCIHAYMHTFIQTCKHFAHRSYIHTYIHTHTHMHVYMYACMHVCMYACTHTGPYTHTCILHTYIHACIQGETILTLGGGAPYFSMDLCLTSLRSHSTRKDVFGSNFCHFGLRLSDSDSFTGNLYNPWVTSLPAGFGKFILVRLGDLGSTSVQRPVIRA